MTNLKFAYGIGIGSILLVGSLMNCSPPTETFSPVEHAKDENSHFDNHTSNVDREAPLLSNGLAGQGDFRSFAVSSQGELVFIGELPYPDTLYHFEVLPDVDSEGADKMTLLWAKDTALTLSPGSSQQVKEVTPEALPGKAMMRLWQNLALAVYERELSETLNGAGLRVVNDAVYDLLESDELTFALLGTISEKNINQVIQIKQARLVEVLNASDERHHEIVFDLYFSLGPVLSEVIKKAVLERDGSARVIQFLEKMMELPNDENEYQAWPTGQKLHRWLTHPFQLRMSTFEVHALPVTYDAEDIINHVGDAFAISLFVLTFACIFILTVPGCGNWF